MNVTFTRNTAVRGKAYQRGQTADIDERAARFLIAIGKAVEAKAEQKAPAKKATKTSTK